MKNITCLTILLLGFVNTVVFSQTDTVFTTHTIESGTLEPQHFLNEYERAFRVMTPAKWMFRCDLNDAIPINLNGDFGFSGGIEAKLTNTFSIHVNALYMANKATNYWPAENELSLQGNVRWYPNMGSGIRAQKSAPNFSGNYWGIGVTTNQFYTTEYFSKYLSYSISYGVQRRLLRYGYFDLSINGGVKQFLTPRYQQNWILFAAPKAAWGLALYTPNKKGKEAFSACELFKCYSEKRSMWKIDLFHLLNEAEYVPKIGKALNINPYIAYEHKLGKSPFSIEASIQEKYEYFDNPQQVDKRSQWQGSLEIRYYYRQKRKILQGKSGNNLSGPFWAINANHLDSWNHFSDNFNDYTTRSSFQRTSLFGIWGLQYSIGNHGFLQFKIGLGPGTRSERRTDRDGIEYQYNDVGIDADAELKIGLAF